MRQRVTEGRPVVERIARDPAGDLETLTERLRRADVLHLTSGRPTGTAWLSLPAALDTASDWHDELARREGDRRAAASFLANWLATTPALLVGLPALLADVVPVLRAEDIRVHRHAEGYVDRYAMAPSAVEEFPGGDASLAVAADLIVGLTRPLVDRLSDALPIGAVAVWGGVADALAAHALWFAREIDADQPTAWGRVERLLDHLEARAPVGGRPRLLPVSWSGGTTHYAVRGTCCLYYRTCTRPLGEDDYCSTCPLRSEASRTGRLLRHLESTT